MFIYAAAPSTKHAADYCKVLITVVQPSPPLCFIASVIVSRRVVKVPLNEAVPEFICRLFRTDREQRRHQLIEGAGDL